MILHYLEALFFGPSKRKVLKADLISEPFDTRGHLLSSRSSSRIGLHTASAPNPLTRWHDTLAGLSEPFHFAFSLGTFLVHNTVNPSVFQDAVSVETVSSSSWSASNIIELFELMKYFRVLSNYCGIVFIITRDDKQNDNSLSESSIFRFP